MIAHNKFKVISAVVLAAFVAVGTAVPCFASVATDDSGNWSPSGYYVIWSIYNTDTGEYDNVNVTSSLSVDGLSFTFPYNTTGVTRVQMVLYSGLSSNVYIDGLSFDGYITYESSSISGLIDLSSSSVFSRYYYSGDDLTYSFASFGSDNPFSYSEFSDSLLPFNRCIFAFYPNVVSGYLTITFTSFILGGEDISSLITVQNLDNAGDDLLNLAEDLSVPTPNIDVESVVENALEGADMESVGQAWSFMSNDLITKMLLIVVSFALLGYILYGKKEASGK